jgi:CBS domain-containing protein
MRDKFPTVNEATPLLKTQSMMQENGLKALPVVRHSKIIGIVTLEDISRVYSMMSTR